MWRPAIHTPADAGAAQQQSALPEWKPARCAQDAHGVQAKIAALSAAVEQLCTGRTVPVVVLALEATERFLECLLAVTAAGGIAAPLNLRWGPREVASALDACQPVAVCVDSTGQALLQGHSQLASLPVITLAGDISTVRQAGSIRTDLATSVPASSLQPRAAQQGAALICFTSGSTGSPKGALISHAALHSQSWAKLGQLGYCSRDVYLHSLPLYHIGGLSSMVAMLMAGAVQVFQPHYGPASMGHLLHDHQAGSALACYLHLVAMRSASMCHGPCPFSSQGNAEHGCGSLCRHRPGIAT